MRNKHMIPFPFANTNNTVLDPLSSLPDSLLAHILSFLSTRDAAATSAISTRFRRLWPALAVSLDLDFPSFLPLSRARRPSFSALAHRSLSLSPSLRRLRLSLLGFGPSPSPDLPSWLSLAAARGLHELDLCLPKGKLVKIPDCVFSCESLTILKLQTHRDYNFMLPSPAGLRRLKVLHLKSIPLLGGEFLTDLFANCTLVEEVVAEECRVDVFGIEDARNLLRLEVCRCEWVGAAEIRVAAARCLRRFRYVGPAASGHCLEGLEALEVVLDLSSPAAAYGSEEECRESVVRLVQMVGSAKSLTLSPWCTQNLSRALRLKKSLRAQDEVLKQLAIMVERKDDCVRAVAPLLLSFASLESLSVSVLPSTSLRKGTTCDDRRPHEVHAKGAMKELRKVKLEHVDESKTGLELVKFLLKNGRALKKMTIIPSKDGLEHAKFRRKVSMIRKASRDATVEYCMTS